jgi:hypothetical protein
MKVLAPVVFIFLFSCKSSKGRLEKQVQTLEFSYVSWACDCANWATSSDLARYEDDELADHCIYVEPASLLLALPDSIGYNSDKVRFTGQFYCGEGFPEGYSSDQRPESARVFRYVSYQILQSNFAEAKKLNTP